MVVETLRGVPFDPRAAAALAIECGARVSGGTRLATLGTAISNKYNLNMITTDSEAMLCEALASGAVAIANVGNANRKGAFSNSGHYVAILAAIDNSALLVVDPYYYAGKWTSYGRQSQIAPLYKGLVSCSVSTMATETSYRAPNYYIFKRA